MPKPRHIIAVASTAGGVGKTSIVYHSSVVLADEGHKVLVCDMDPQGDITDTFLGNDEPVTIEALDELASQTSPMYAAIIKKRPAEEVIQPTNHPNISVLGSGMDLYEWDEPLRKAMNPGARLRNVLRPVQELYDYILIDCPPAPSWSTKMGLLYATGFILALDASKKSIIALRRILQLAQEAREEGSNPRLELLGGVLNKYQPRTILDKGYDLVYQHVLGEKFLKTHVPLRKPYQEAHSKGEPITLRKAHSELADVFKQLLDEISVWPNEP